MKRIFKNSYTPLLITAILSAPIPVHAQTADGAQNAAATEQTQTTQEAPVKLKAGKKLKELEAYTATLLSGLQENEATYLYALRQEFGIIRSIKVVSEDINSAVKSCGEKNPEIKQPLEVRYNTWKDAIIPRIAVAETELNATIQRQSFRPVVRVKMLLDHVESAFEERDAHFEKVPITSLEACNDLQKSFDETQNNLSALLEETAQKLKNLSVATPKQQTPKQDTKNETS